MLACVLGREGSRHASVRVCLLVHRKHGGSGAVKGITRVMSGKAMVIVRFGGDAIPGWGGEAGWCMGGRGRDGRVL